MSQIEQADQYFANGCNCAQAVAAAFAEGEGLSKDVALRAMSGFGGGLGRSGETCGVVSGAVFILGLHFGADIPGPDPEAKGRLYARVRDFLARFTAKHGAIACRDLLGCDIGTPEGLARIQAEKMHETHCAKFVHDAAAIVKAMLTA
jgi:C_GCAxxG_C_C family probable redox protein